MYALDHLFHRERSDRRGDPGEGLRSIDGPHPLTPTLSPWEREPTVSDNFTLGNLKMQLGMIGLGRMGGNIVRRLMRHGHSTVVYDKDPKAVAAIPADGALGPGALEEFVAKLEKPRTPWR